MDDRFRKKNESSTIASTSVEDSRQSKQKTSFAAKQKKHVKPTWLKPSESTTEDEQVYEFQNGGIENWYDYFMIL